MCRPSSNLDGQPGPPTTEVMARDVLQVSFGRWIAVAVPLCVTMTTVTWLFLLAVFQPSDVTKIPPIVRSKEELNR